MMKTKKNKDKYYNFDDCPCEICQTKKQLRAAYDEGYIDGSSRSNSFSNDMFVLEMLKIFVIGVMGYFILKAFL